MSPTPEILGRTSDDPRDWREACGGALRLGGPRFMLRWQTLVGAVLGLGLGLAIVSLARSTPRQPVASGPVLSECGGHLREMVIQYEPSARPMVGPIYRAFLGLLEPDVTIRVLCPDHGAYDDFAAAVGPVRCRLAPIFTGHPITTWARDRWLALAPATPGSPTIVWSPRGEAAQEVWPARAGDEQVGQDLAAALAPAVQARRSTLYFDAGDFLADDENVFAVARVLPRNLQRTAGSQEDFLKLVAKELKRRVILLDPAPDHHAGMFMASVGARTMLVGDPQLACGFIPSDAAHRSGAEFMGFPGGPDFSADTQRLFDSVAHQCATAGYRVVRIPVVPARDGRTYLTFVNVLLDRQAGRKIVYLPCYRGVDPLNAAARAIWESLGYEVRPVDCTTIYRHFGCLHCLVNVLKRT